MSILSSTNSGKQTTLTEELLLSNGWELNVDLSSIKEYRYISKNSQTDKHLNITFKDRYKCYFYKGKYKNIIIEFHITTIGDLQDLISYYFDALKDPTEAFLKIKNSKNVVWYFDCETEDILKQNILLFFQDKFHKFHKN